jgi:hypothetical protein
MYIFRNTEWEYVRNLIISTKDTKKGKEKAVLIDILDLIETWKWTYKGIIFFNSSAIFYLHTHTDHVLNKREHHKDST